MQVFYKSDEEHLPYILSSAIWHYLQHTEEIVNTTEDKELVQHYLKLQKVIKEEMNEAVKHPIPAESFDIRCDKTDTAQLLTEILHFYLDETKEIIQTIEDPGITQRCLKDVVIIQDQLIKAIRTV